MYWLCCVDICSYVVLTELVFLQVMHGGLFSRDDVTLSEISKIDRNRQPPEEGISMMSPYYLSYLQNMPAALFSSVLNVTDLS
jgi:hypothetical protein